MSQIKIGDFGEESFRFALLMSLPLGILGFSAKIGDYKWLSLLMWAPMAIAIVRALFFTYESDGFLTPDEMRRLVKTGRRPDKKEIRSMSIKIPKIYERPLGRFSLVLAGFGLILCLYSSLYKGTNATLFGILGGASLLIAFLAIAIFSFKHKTMDSLLEEDEKIGFSTLLNKLEGKKHGD